MWLNAAGSETYKPVGRKIGISSQGCATQKTWVVQNIPNQRTSSKGASSSTLWEWSQVEYFSSLMQDVCKKNFTSDETMQRSSIRSSIYSPTCARNITRIIAREKHRDVGNFLCSSKLRKWWGRNCKLSSFGLIFAKHRSINRTTTSELS